jgi:Spy/CpxP family protein refolding chaperone
MAAMFMASLDSLVLKPEQKTAVDGIEADLLKTHEAAKAPREKLEGDVADGVLAGKIDHAKTDADIRALTAAVAGTQPSVQDAMNRLYKTLDVEQRKKLVEVMREKGKEMHAHGFGEHEHEGGHEHEGKGPGHEHEGKGPGHEHEGKGPGGMEHGGPGGMEHGPGGMEHGGPLMQLGDALGLTAEQKEKIHVKLEAQMKARHTAMKDKMAAAEKHMAAIGDAFVSDKFDAKKAGVGTQAPEMVKAMASMRIEFVETILAVLTPEQRAKFAAHVREHAAEEEAE